MRWISDPKQVEGRNGDVEVLLVHREELESLQGQGWGVAAVLGSPQASGAGVQPAVGQPLLQLLCRRGGLPKVDVPVLLRAQGAAARGAGVGPASSDCSCAAGWPSRTQAQDDGN